MSAEIKFNEGDLSVQGFDVGSCTENDRLEIRCIEPDMKESFYFDKVNDVEVKFAHKETKLLREYKGYVQEGEAIEMEQCWIPPYVLKALAMLEWGYR